MEEVMNAQTTAPTWPTRLGVTVLAVVVAMIAAAAIANVPAPNASLDTQSSYFDGSVIMDSEAHSRAYAAAGNGSYAVGTVEFENAPALRDDELGPLSETSNTEIAD
jgi:hypothetical protein